MKLHKWKDVRDRHISKKRQTKTNRAVAQEVLRLNLRAVRELLGKRQADVARAAKMAQSEVSRIEQASNLMLETTRRYVKALGGELEVTAVFGDKRVVLHLPSAA